MSKPKLILIGAGGHAHACIDVIEQNGYFQIAGLVGMPEEMHDQHMGYSVIATDVNLPKLAKDFKYACIALGQTKSPDDRMRLHRLALELGFALPPVVAPTAHVSRHAVVGVGTIVMHGAIINAGAKVGNNCIVNSLSLIEHDVTVEDHCHISTGAILNGNVRIGTGSFVGSGSIVMEGVSLGTRCVVGMGLSVRHDQTNHAQYVGGKK